MWQLQLDQGQVVCELDDFRYSMIDTFISKSLCIKYAYELAGFVFAHELAHILLPWPKFHSRQLSSLPIDELAVLLFLDAPVEMQVVFVSEFNWL